MLKRLLVCLAFSTCCFMDTWVEFAEGESAYFSRYDAVYSVAIPVIICQIAVTAGIFCAWEFIRRNRAGHGIALHAVFLATCLVPFGIISVALLRAAPFD